MSSGPEPPPPVGSRRPPGRLGRWFAVGAIVVVVALAGYGSAVFLLNRTPGGSATLTVYTYASLFGGNCGAPAFDSIFGAFGRAHGVHVAVVCPPGTLASTLSAQKNAPSADLVIGLDEVTAPQAEAAGLVVPYVSPQLVHVPPILVQELSPTHGVTPYESGYLSIDVNRSFEQATRGAVDHASFLNYSNSSVWSRQLMVEDPLTDIVGEEFLLWQIEFYTAILHQDWTRWWSAVDPFVRVAPDWSSAFAAFTTPPNNPGGVVSYTTDTAYAAAQNSSGSFNATVSNWNGSQFGWRTVYGLGIVNGSRHTALDQAFIDWFLTGAVQSQIPTNEWEYPANSSVPLPPVFAHALDPRPIIALNDDITPAQIAASLPVWLETWQSLQNAAAG